MSVLDCLQNIALAPLPGYAQIQLTGADAFSFLHRLSTQNCHGLQPGHSCLNALLTPKGRFVSLLHQAVLPDNSLLLLGGDNQQQQIEQPGLARMQGRHARALTTHLRRLSVASKSGGSRNCSNS